MLPEYHYKSPVESKVISFPVKPEENRKATSEPEFDVNEDDLYTFLDEISDDEYNQLLGQANTEVEVVHVDDSHIRVDLTQDQIVTARNAMGSLASAVSSFPNLFAHTGAFCGHCIAGMGNLGGVTGGAGGGLGMGHFHADGSWHAEGHDHGRSSASPFSSAVEQAWAMSGGDPDLFEQMLVRLFPSIRLFTDSVGLNDFFHFGPQNSVGVSHVLPFAA